MTSKINAILGLTIQAVEPSSDWFCHSVIMDLDCFSLVLVLLQAGSFQV